MNRRVCAALMKGIDAANFAKIMLADMGAPLIRRQHISALLYLQRADGATDHNRSAAPSQPVIHAAPYFFARCSLLQNVFKAKTMT